MTSNGRENMTSNGDGGGEKANDGSKYEVWLRHFIFIFQFFYCFAVVLLFMFFSFFSTTLPVPAEALACSAA